MSQYCFYHLTEEFSNKNLVLFSTTSLHFPNTVKFGHVGVCVCVRAHARVCHLYHTAHVAVRGQLQLSVLSLHVVWRQVLFCVSVICCYVHHANWLLSFPPHLEVLRLQSCATVLYFLGSEDSDLGFQTCVRMLSSSNRNLTVQHCRPRTPWSSNGQVYLVVVRSYCLLAQSQLSLLFPVHVTLASSTQRFGIQDPCVSYVHSRVVSFPSH